MRGDSCRTWGPGAARNPGEPVILTGIDRVPGTIEDGRGWRWSAKNLPEVKEILLFAQQ
jgi:hypothetical protein